MKSHSIGFIGGGHIAEALIRGIVTSGYADPGQIRVSDPHQERLEHLHRTMGIRIASNNNELASEVDLIFLTVKPNQIALVAEEIKDHLKNNPFIISVAAGKSLHLIKEHLNNYKNICRIMPNLASSVKKSTISLYADPELSTQCISEVHSLLSSTGKVFRINEEKLMASITALSGSAPAYYVMMADALVNYGVSQGLDKELATDMILSTMEGSAIWASNAKIELGELWKHVVTPGGTTEAGINYYTEKGFIDIFIEGLDRATRKAKGMGDE
jgi:pyrroline-5-carboxylate reductase